MAIRIGIIGTGFGARVHLPLLKRHEAFEVIAVAGVRRGRAAEEAAQASVSAYGDWKEMIRDAGLDAVVLASSPQLHADMVEEAASAGIHVLCEKPPGMGVRDALRMRDAVKSSGVVGAMNFEWRYEPARLRIAELLRDGRLGRILHIAIAQNSGRYPALRNVPAGWLWKRESGGGMLGAVGSHLIDALQVFGGPIQSAQGSVKVNVPVRTLDSGVEETADADDSFASVLRFSSGAEATLRFTLSTRGDDLRIEVHGTEGTAVDVGDREVQLSLAGGDFSLLELEPRLELPDISEAVRRFAHPQMRLYSDFAAKIRGEAAEGLPSLDDALRVQGVMDAIYQSSERGFLTVSESGSLM